MRRLAVAALVAIAGVAALPSGASAAPPQPTPLLAYYYQWFNASSWNRAKIAYPLLGRYASGERSVMRQHIQWAKQVGIDGFIVSWKSTPTNDRRLRELARIARRQHFHLTIIYQGLDFQRQPLRVGRIRSDLEMFARRFAPDPVFHVLGRPLVIWSGTWRFSRAQVRSVTDRVRPQLTVLASEKDVTGYERLAGVVDGDAYYWSSADALTTPGYARKLRDMGRAVHRHHGLWIVPAAGGFDARLIGGTRVVPRRGGATLRRALDVASTAAPDAIGIISWNEFTENTYIEPSDRYGFQALRVVADVEHAHPPTVGDLDSSSSPATGASYGLPLLGGFAAVLLGGASLMGRRHRRAANRQS